MAIPLEMTALTVENKKKLMIQPREMKTVNVSQVCGFLDLGLRLLDFSYF